MTKTMSSPLINRVTFTGVDDTVDPTDLFHTWDDYGGHVEFGVLFSQTREGERRYPNRHWVDLFTSLHPEVDKAAHLCGGFLRLFATGPLGKPGSYITNNFKRVQLNMNWRRVDHDVRVGLLRCVKNNPTTEFIIQHNSNNRDAYRYFEYCPNVSILFDQSGGRGWDLTDHPIPKPIAGYSCGYAGGIGPENIGAVLRAINQVCPGGRTWIDMESSLRNKENHFDLDACHFVMEVVGRHLADRA